LREKLKLEGFALVTGSYVLRYRYIFDIVAAARSAETFVAAALLVSVAMGQAADLLGLSATTGAFAAGVLLAGNRYIYRAQVQADNKPFEGILLGTCTAPIPKMGSYVGETEPMPRRSPNAIEREREINLSPGGSVLPTGPIPGKGKLCGGDGAYAESKSQRYRKRN
jgi:hypothetical protein